VSDNTPTLPDDTIERIRALSALIDKAEEGDKEAKRELRAAVRSSSEEVIARVSDIASDYRAILAKTASGGDALMLEGLKAYMFQMEDNLLGGNPTPLEALLAERIVSCWMLVELMEALTSGWFNRERKQRVSPQFLLQMVKLQESANRRYLAAIKTLAQVRKLQGNAPAVQVNTQVNIAGGS
jgi:flagellar motor switch protein FliM